MTHFEMLSAASEVVRACAHLGEGHHNSRRRNLICAFLPSHLSIQWTIISVASTSAIQREVTHPRKTLTPTVLDKRAVCPPQGESTAPTWILTTPRTGVCPECSTVGPIRKTVCSPAKDARGTAAVRWPFSVSNDAPADTATRLHTRKWGQHRPQSSPTDGHVMAGISPRNAPTDGQSRWTSCARPIPGDHVRAALATRRNRARLPARTRSAEATDAAGGRVGRFR